MNEPSFVFPIIEALWWIGGALGAVVGVLVGRRLWGAAKMPQVALAAAGTLVAAMIIAYGTRWFGFEFGFETIFAYAFREELWRGVLYSLPLGILIGLRFVRSTPASASEKP